MGLTLFLIVAACLIVLIAATYRRPRDQRPHRDRRQHRVRRQQREWRQRRYQSGEIGKGEGE